jgi:glycosyltransferase involved in cell wall biosynthesis
MKKTLEENYGCRGEKVVVIPHGVVRAGLKNWDRNGRCNTLKIISLGFLRQEKKLEHLLQAFLEFSMKNPSAKLFLIGDLHPHDNDKYVENIKKFISNLKLEDKVRRMNFVSEGELDKLIYDSDFIILVSTKDYFIETSGALARVADFGKPVVCSRVPKFQGELKDGYDCLMVAPENVDELVKAMKILAKNNKLKKQLASNLKRHFRARYWSEVAKMHLNCYGSLLKFKRK